MAHIRIKYNILLDDFCLNVFITLVLPLIKAVLILITLCTAYTLLCLFCILISNLILQRN